MIIFGFKKREFFWNHEFLLLFSKIYVENGRSMNRSRSWSSSRSRSQNFWQAEAVAT
jgi:hypothetical protein